MRREPLDYLGPVLTVTYLLLGAIQWRWGSHLVAWLLFAFALWNVGFLFLWALVFVGSRRERETTSGVCRVFNRVAQGEITAAAGADLLMNQKKAARRFRAMWGP